jgi:formate--tetrahydrofolate ligase
MIREIRDVAADLGLTEADYELHGRHRAKVHLDLPADGPPGKYVLVTATTATSAGSGKTVTSIGLAMGLARAGHRSAVAVRESAQGPTFGSKGGGAGGGAAQVVPLEEALLGLTDGADVAAATNLLAAVVEDAVHRGGTIDPAGVTWRRVLDVDDRSLRKVVVGLGGRVNGPPRETGFDITAACEVMAVLALSRDRADLRARLDALVPAWDGDGKPVTAAQLGAAGAMAVLLRNALQPNLLQTSEGTPALVHAGPFGNLSIGCSSVVADRFALSRVDYLVTEAGFAADLGGEKFFDLKCAASGLYPDAVVLVTNVPSLREHGTTANLAHHVSVLRSFGVPVVVAINRFPDDTAEELASLKDTALASGAHGVQEHHAFVRGGEGCTELAAAVVDAASGPKAAPVRLYDDAASCQEKVHALATRVYGAANVSWEPAASRTLAKLVDAGYGHLPVCVAKTHLSLSHDATLKGAPSGFTLPVREVRLAAGAGYLTVLTGDILTMPGLPAHARLLGMDLAPDGTVVGLT